MKLQKKGVGHQLSFALYGAANRVARLHKPFLEPLRLTFPQYLVMLELLHDSPRTVGQLCSTLSMETGTITPILKRLQTIGYVSRTRDTKDERKVFIALTETSTMLSKDILSISNKIKSACKLHEIDIDNLRKKLEDLGNNPVDT